jgi:isopenicillin N synthase-like dioxygenase
MAVSNENPGSIPVIDISGDLPEAEVAKQLVDAAATYGFVYIKNEGKDIPIEAINNIFDLVSTPIPCQIYQNIYLQNNQSKKFFSSPIEEKQPCKIQENVRVKSSLQQTSLSKRPYRTEDG